MTKPNLKLAKLTDTKPSKLSVSLPPDLLSDLEVYANIYEQTYGEKQPVSALVPSMLAGFLASDHGFKKAKRELA
ncbi:MAG: transposase [Robiginitomaculum sp.]|nr:MAG: transposase [Robiginitomaculum sp.]